MFKSAAHAARTKMKDIFKSVKKLGQERFRRNAQEQDVVILLKRICQAVRSMVSCTQGHFEKFLMKDDGDDQFKD